MPGPCTPEPALQRGFTLVELLVAMSVVALIMLATLSTLRTMAQTENRLDHKLLQADNQRATTQLLQQTLGRISSRQRQTEAGSAPNLLFQARADSIEWLGVMPARHGAGGLTFFRLALEPQADGPPALVLRMSTWQGQSRMPDWRQAEARTLLGAVTQLQIHYQDDRPMPALWSTSWPHPNRLPDRVRIEIMTESQQWPPMVIPLRILPASPAGASLFSIG